MRKSCGLLPVLALLWGTSLGAQTRMDILKRAVWDTPGQDLKQIVIRPFSEPRRALGGSAVLLGLLLTDGWTTRQYQDLVAPIGERLEDQLQIPSLYPNAAWELGLDGYAYTAVGGIYAAGLLTGNVKLQEAGILTTKAILESYVVSHLVLKTLFARNRPNHPLKGGELEEPYTRDPFDFFNWHEPYLLSEQDGTAFPSWHFSLYFSLAKVMQLHFDNYWIPYTLSMFPLLYHADGHKHWVSDMVAGAVIGTFVGKVVFENYHSDLGEGDSHSRPGALDWSWGVTPFYGRWAPYVSVSF